MAGAIEKKKNDVQAELEGSPRTHVDARSSILANIALSREFAHTYLKAICEALPGGKIVDGTTTTMSLDSVCQILAQQRMVCYGALNISKQFRKFSLPGYETVNGSLGLSEPNTSFMGIKATSIDETYPINLSTVPNDTQTQDSNTFSVYVRDYYLVRSRTTGELEPTSGNLSAYTTPDGADVVFGNTVSWGESVASEEEANTWNYNWAKTNIGGVTIQNTGAYNELTVLRLEEPLTPVAFSTFLRQEDQGIRYTSYVFFDDTDIDGVSDGDGQLLNEDSVLAYPYENHIVHEDHYIREEDKGDTYRTLLEDASKILMEDSIPLMPGSTYIPLGPAFADKFYLKRHADYVNTFTIIGTTLANSIEVTGISDTDIAKMKYGDVIGGTGIPDDNVSIEAVQTADSKIRLSNTGIATESGTVTLTVNSVPFGYQAHDIFCQIEVVAEGLVTRDSWKPIGDGAGGYSGANEGPDDLLVANTSQFIDMLGFFDPGTAGSSDLVKGSSAAYSSEGKEYGGTNYPDIEVNPFKPANQGTTKARATKGGEFTGTQPDGLGDKDIWCGRFVAWNKERTGMNSATPPESVPAGEYRYIIDNAEKFFYAPSRNASYSGGSMSVGADLNNPAYILADLSRAGAELEPRAKLPRTGLATVIANMKAATSITIPGGGSGEGNAAGSAYTPATITSSAGSIGADTNTTHTISPNSGTAVASGSGNNITYAWSSSPPATTTLGYYFSVSDNLIIKNDLYWNSTINGDGTSSGDTWSTEIGWRRAVHVCLHNFYKQFVITNIDYLHLFTSVEALKGVAKLRDPNVDPNVAIAPRDIPAGTGSSGTGISDQAFDDYILSNTVGGRTEWEQSVDTLNSVLASTRTTLSQQNRTGNNNSNSSKGSDIPVSNPNLAGGFAAFTAETDQLKSVCDQRINEVDARIGVPKYVGSQSSRGTAPGIHVEKIPSSNTAGGLIPYGRSIYNNVNHLLGQDVDLLGGIIKDIESLNDLIGMVKTARNKYEIYSGRDKEYNV